MGEPVFETREATRCHAALNDGECFWEHCPQERDGEPLLTERTCPLAHDGCLRCGEGIEQCGC